MTSKEYKDLSVKEITKAAEQTAMEKYDISQKIVFKTGTYELNSDANFNFMRETMRILECILISIVSYFFGGIFKKDKQIMDKQNNDKI